MTIPIGAMSLSSRYETPRSGVLSLADEEEEEEEEEEQRGDGDGMIENKNNRKTREDRVTRVIRREEEGGERGLKMDVDVDVDV